MIKRLEFEIKNSTIECEHVILVLAFHQYSQTKHKFWGFNKPNFMTRRDLFINTGLEIF